MTYHTKQSRLESLRCAPECSMKSFECVKVQHIQESQALTPVVAKLCNCGPRKTFSISLHCERSLFKTVDFFGIAASAKWSVSLWWFQPFGPITFGKFRRATLFYIRVSRLLNQKSLVCTLCGPHNMEDPGNVRAILTSNWATLIGVNRAPPTLHPDLMYHPWQRQMRD